MRAILGITTALTSFVLFAGLTRGDGQQDDPHKKAKAAQAAIIALSEKLDAPDLRDRAKAIVQSHESEDISSVFKRVNRGGMGVGPLAPSPNLDGVERLIIAWMRKPPTAEEVAKHKDDMLRVTRVIRAMSELAPNRVPKNARPQIAKEWAEVAKEFHETALGLHHAVEKGEPTAIRDASRKINNTCCHCHSLLD